MIYYEYYKNSNDNENRELALKDVEDYNIRYGDYIKLQGVKNGTVLWDAVFLILGKNEGSPVMTIGPNDKYDESKSVWLYDINTNKFLGHSPTVSSLAKTGLFSNTVQPGTLDYDQIPCIKNFNTRIYNSNSNNYNCTDIKYNFVRINKNDNEELIEGMNILLITSLINLNEGKTDYLYMAPVNADNYSSVISAPEEQYINGMAANQEASKILQNIWLMRLWSYPCWVSTSKDKDYSFYKCDLNKMVVKKVKPSFICKEDSDKYKQTCAHKDRCTLPEYILTKECKIWGKDKDNRPDYDIMMKDYCMNEGKGTPECGCFEGSFDEESINLFNQLHEYNPAIPNEPTASCYHSCMKQEAYRDLDVDENPCQLKICTNVVMADNLINSSISDIKQKCEYNEGGKPNDNSNDDYNDDNSKPKRGSSDANNGTQSQNNTTNSTSNDNSLDKIWENYKVFIILCVIIILLLCSICMSKIN